MKVRGNTKAVETNDTYTFFSLRNEAGEHLTSFHVAVLSNGQIDVYLPHAEVNLITKGNVSCRLKS